MTHESTEDDKAKYIVAVEVSTLVNIPTGFTGRRFNACEYAVFDCTLQDETSGRFFQYFFKIWLKEQNLSQPETRNTKRGNRFSIYPTFEVYDKNYEVSPQQRLWGIGLQFLNSLQIFFIRNRSRAAGN